MTSSRNAHALHLDSQPTWHGVSLSFGELSLRSSCLPGDIFLNKQCPIFRKIMSPPPHSSGCPASHLQKYLKTILTIQKNRKGRKVPASVQGIKTLSMSGALSPSRVLRGDVRESSRERTECGSKSRARSLGVHHFRSQKPGQLNRLGKCNSSKWKVVKTKVLRFDGRQWKMNQYTHLGRGYALLNATLFLPKVRAEKRL